LSEPAFQPSVDVPSGVKLVQRLRADGTIAINIGFLQPIYDLIKEQMERLYGQGPENFFGTCPKDGERFHNFSTLSAQAKLVEPG